MRKSYGFLVCILVVVIDVIAGILGIEAEIAQNKVKHMKVWIFECRDPSYQAFKLGLASAILLAVAHAIANFLGGCVCVFSGYDFQKANANKKLAAGFLAFSWIALVVGFLLLIIGALENSKSRKSCGLAHHRLLSLGGILCFIHGILAVSYYVSAIAVHREEKKKHSPVNPAVGTPV